ncbi:MAG: DUF3108 domain-containing protein [Panacagrimonas sp.]
MNLRVATVVLAWLCAGGAAPAAELIPSEATYALSRGPLTLGEARFRLAPFGDPGCWRYEYDARPSGLAKLFIGELSERSDFCIVDGALHSQYFEFKRSDKPKDNFSLTFNWRDGVVRSSIGELRPLESGMIDRLAMQIEVQRWVIDQGGKVGSEEKVVTKLDEDRVKTYRFRITGNETIDAPAGKFACVRVERVDDKKKSTRFWLAPGRDYVAVRVEQVKEDSEQIKMLLK